MALVQRVSFKLVAPNVPARNFSYFLPSAVALADVAGHAQDVAEALDAASGMVISGAHVTTNLALTGMKTTPITGTFPSLGVILAFDVAASNFGWSAWLAGVRPIMVVDNQLDDTLGNIAALQTQLVAANAGFNSAAASDDDGGDLVAATSAVLSTRRK